MMDKETYIEYIDHAISLLWDTENYTVFQMTEIKSKFIDSWDLRK